MKKLDFIVIGTYRAGTTWLQKVFENHSEIFVPKEKETFYFSRYFNRGPLWYNSFFKNSNQHKVKGEICPSYFANTKAAKRIAEYNLKIKIILIIRNPIDQIKSMCKLHLNRNNSISTELDAEAVRKKYINNVLYYSNLKPYWNSFSENNILILNYDKLVDDPNIFLTKIYNFLDVKFENQKINKKINKAFKPRYIFVERFVSKFGEFLRKKNFYFISNLIKKIGFLKLIRTINSSKNENEITISEDGIRYISRTVKKEIEQLNKLTGKDFCINLD